MTRYHLLWASGAALVLAGMACGQVMQGTPAPKRLVGDYGYWSRTQTPPYSAAQIPYGKLTHINHAGVSFNSDGSLNVPDGFLEPELIQDAHSKLVKVLLLLGGDFAALETPGVMQTLWQNLQTFIQSNGYDGLDIDWEYPSTAADRLAFHDLMYGLRRIFPHPRYVLSADIPPWAGSGYDLQNVAPVMDYFNVMMYDCAGPWTDDGQLNSPIFPDPRNPQPYECDPGGSVEQAANIFLTNENIPASQINMGTPFYGYDYTNVTEIYGLCKPCDGQTIVSVPYKILKGRVNQDGWHTLYDPYSLVPYMLRTDGQSGYITYDDAVSTYKRVWYSVWQRGLGGTFMWSLDQDYDGHTQDLLNAMYQASMNQPMSSGSQ